jgi:hypothetical protein
MEGKMTWNKVFQTFKTKFPNLSKEALHWHPHNYGTIKVYFQDGVKATYNSVDNKFTYLKE